MPNALTTRILNSNDRFRICLPNSTAISAQVWWKWAGLAVLFSRQIINRSLKFTLEALTIFLLVYVTQDRVVASKMTTIVHSRGYGIKTGQNLVHVVVE